VRITTDTKTGRLYAASPRENANGSKASPTTGPKYPGGGSQQRIARTGRDTKPSETRWPCRSCDGSEKGYANMKQQTITPPISGELSESAAWVWLSVEVANG
jgi:hypothetical protein